MHKNAIYLYFYIKYKQHDKLKQRISKNWKTFTLLENIKKNFSLEYI